MSAAGGDNLSPYGDQQLGGGFTREATTVHPGEPTGGVADGRAGGEFSSGYHALLDGSLTPEHVRQLAGNY